MRLRLFDVVSKFKHKTWGWGDLACNPNITMQDAATRIQWAWKRRATLAFIYACGKRRRLSMELVNMPPTLVLKEGGINYQLCAQHFNHDKLCF